jgi:hypothetical protein
MQRFLPVLAMFALSAAVTSTAYATPRTRIEYVVTEYNPFTGGRVSTNRYTDKAAADRRHAEAKKAHWVKWRFVGVNEPLRFRRFQNSFAAQDFIENDGPSKTGKLGFAILTNETRNVASKVSLTTVTVPVTDGRGGGDTDEVIDTIDRIIGIIGR